MVIARKDLKFIVPPTEKHTAKVKFSLLVSLPTYQLAGVAQSQAQYTLPCILRTEEKLKILANMIEQELLQEGLGRNIKYDCFGREG